MSAPEPVEGEVNLVACGNRNQVSRVSLGTDPSLEDSIEQLTACQGHPLSNGIISHTQFETEIGRAAQTLRELQDAAVGCAQLLLRDVSATLETMEVDPGYGCSENEPSTNVQLQVTIAEFNERAQDISETVLRTCSFAARKAAKLRSIAIQLGSQTSDSSFSKLAEVRLADTPWTTCVGGAVLTLLSDIYHVIRSMSQGSSATTSDEELWVAPQSFERVTHKYWVEEEHLTEVMLACVTHVPLLEYGKSGRLHDNIDAVAFDHDLWESQATPISSIYFDSTALDLYKARIARIEGAKLLRVRWYGEQPKGDDNLFLELKTHHESWMGDKSAKQRVAVREKDMVYIMSSNKKWTVEIAESLVRSASPKLVGEDLLEATGLLLQIRELVVELELRPCVRTSYLRAAFQSSTSNALRLTMDRDITVTDESKAPAGAWCLSNKGKIKLARTATVPCAVFEVKLAGSDFPEFMERLGHSGAARDGHKFSKFLTGVATFHSDSDHLNTLPYWANDPMFEHMFRPGQAVVARKGTASSSSSDDYKSRGCEITKSTSGTIVKKMNMAAQPRPRGRRFLWIRFLGQSKEQVSQKSIVPKKRPKIEPKTYFAAERTFIQWISAALLLVTVAAFLLTITNEEGVQSGYATGIILTTLAIVVTLYALVIYFRRLYLLQNAKPYGYSDHAGPVVLTMAVACGISVLLYITISLHDPVLSSTAAVISEGGRCMRHNFTGISLLEYQPSDVLVDETRNLLIIPSLSKLTSLPVELGLSETPSDLQILTEFTGFAFEAVTYVDETLYALSEDTVSSTLLAFTWQQTIGATDEHLQLVGRWKLEGKANSEGMTYLPDFGSGPKLLISEEPIAGTSNVFVYDIPTNATADDDKETILPLYQLNAGIFSSGLQKATKIAAMTYFEDVLYLLHDNARVIRGWDMVTATMVSEWITPRVGGEFDKQWEGIAFQRDGSDSSLIIHMTLDTPPQIWSFAMHETIDTASGEVALSFPECAQAF